MNETKHPPELTQPIYYMKRTKHPTEALVSLEVKKYYQTENESFIYCENDKGDGWTFYKNNIKIDRGRLKKYLEEAYGWYADLSIYPVIKGYTLAYMAAINIPYSEALVLMEPNDNSGPMIFHIPTKYVMEDML